VGGGGYVAVEVGLGTSVGVMVGVMVGGTTVGGIVGLGGGWVGINTVVGGVVGGGLNTAVIVRSGVGKTGWGVGPPKAGKLQARAARASNPVISINKRRFLIKPPAIKKRDKCAKTILAILF